MFVGRLLAKRRLRRSPTTRTTGCRSSHGVSLQRMGPLLT